MKILLLTDVPPCGSFSGALLTETMCNLIGNENLIGAFVVNKNLSYLEPSETLTFPYKKWIKPNEGYHSKSRIKRNIQCHVNEWYSTHIKIPKLTKKIAHFAQEYQVDRIWAILQGQTIIRLACALSTTLKIPLHTQIWDDVSWWLEHNNITPYWGKKIQYDFDSILKKSKVIGTASEAMSTIYEKKHAAKTVSFESMLPSSCQSTIKNFPNKADELLIGFSGQFYATGAFESFLDALKILKWTIKKRSIRLIVFGYAINLSKNEMQNIQFLGYHSQEEVLKVLSRCHLLYCPYPFENRFRFTAETSFPAKLTTYLATSVPTLFHGPAYASPYCFLKKNNAGYLLDSQNSHEIADYLISIFSNPDAYNLISSQAHSTFSRCLTHTVLNTRIHDFFNFFSDKEEKV